MGAKYRICIAVAMIMLFVLVLGGCSEPAVSKVGSEHVSAEQETEKDMEETVVLNQRQKDILEQGGLPAEYDELTVIQKNAITSIEEMLEYLEETYGKTFVYAGYVDGSGVEKEQLTAYPEDGTSADLVTVTRTYVDGEFIYEDDYETVKAAPLYQAAMEKYLSGKMNGAEAVILAELTQLEGEADEDSILDHGQGIVRVFLKSSAWSAEQMKAAAENFGNDMVKEHDGAACEIRIYLLDDEAFAEVNSYSYERILQENVDCDRCVCRVSGYGDVTVK